MFLARGGVSRSKRGVSRSKNGVSRSILIIDRCEIRGAAAIVWRIRFKIQFKARRQGCALNITLQRQPACIS